MSDTDENPTIDCKQPSKHKLAILTFIGLLAPVYFIPQLLSQLFANQALIVTVMAVGIIVALMNYAIMPVLKRVFRSWINSNQEN